MNIKANPDYAYIWLTGDTTRILVSRYPVFNLLTRLRRAVKKIRFIDWYVNTIKSECK
jgi:hypothetical protein